MSDTTLPKLDWRVVFNQATPPGRKGWGRVRAAQMTEMADAVRIAAWGQAFNALLLVYILSSHVALFKLAAWLLGLGLMMLITMRHLRKIRGRAIHSIPRRAIDRTAYHSTFFGLLWTVPAVYFFADVGHPEQLAICVVTASMMAGAAFIFSTVPPAAAAYVFILGPAATNMLSNSGSPMIAGIGPIYTAALLVMVYASGRAYMQRKCVDLALEEQTETVSLLLREYENSDADWLWQTNRNLVFENVSARFARAIGYPRAELEKMSILDLLGRSARSEAAGAKLAEAVAETIRGRGAISDILVPIAAIEGTKWIELSARPRSSSHGRFIGYHGVGSDVTAARQAANRIAHMARHDALTGLPNRLHLLDALGAALVQVQEGGGRCAVLLIDLDRFKSVNDSLGHVAGDHLLRQVGARFDPILSAGMTIGRLGGDEFALVIPKVPDTETIERICTDIVEALEEPFVYDDQHLFVGASIGVALGPDDGASVEELVRNADLALYRAKAEGGNDTCFYQPSFHTRAEERRRIELAMRGALDQGEFSLVYQPVVDAETTRVRSFEALLRWHNPELGSISPVQFVPIAEDTGMIGRIGEWVLRNACAEAMSWPPEVSVAVNISPLQLQDPSFMLTLVSALSKSGLDPRRLELEITETVFLNITQATQTVFQQVQALGVHLAIDDFGTGYSSLAYLRGTSFDTLKIDRSFIGSLSRADPGSDAIIKAVVALSRSLGMATIAEGVETEEQLAIVRELGCTLIQGYYFSEPVAAPAVKAMIETRRRAAA